LIGAAPGRERVIARPLRRALAAVPRGAWLCFVVATVNACVWAVVTPSFQVPDEIPHTAYVQYLAETGDLPRPFDTAAGHFDPSLEQSVAVNGVPFSYEGVPGWSPRHARAVQRRLAAPLGRVHEPAAAAAASYPPLYYALEAIPYRIAHSGSFYDRLLAMRLFSALFAGLTAAFCFLFVRELLPGAPWAWRIGGLAVALQPLVASIGGGVNPDSLLWAASSALLWLICRAFRRRLSSGVAAGIGAALAVALLTKGAAYALVPAAALALALLAQRDRGARRPALIAVAVAAVPFGAWLLASALVWHRGAGANGVGLAHARHTSLGGQLAYLWETFLPRLPGMPQEIHGHPTYPLWQDYFQGLVARYGYFEFGFPQRVNLAALAIALALLALAGAAIWRARPELRRRRGELACYLLLAVTILVGVAVAGYHFRSATGLNFEQTRYLFPLLPLYAAVFALAARGAGRYGRAAGVLLVFVVVAHNLFSLLLTLQHYYT
jgi:4-amino-4-deoxy-L-arabinose transferase-like glycosyltransferase